MSEVDVGGKRQFEYGGAVPITRCLEEGCRRVTLSKDHLQVTALPSLLKAFPGHEDIWAGNIIEG